jgi:hypothetical protein
MDEEKADQSAAGRPRGQQPNPALMTSKGIKPGRKWMPLHGAHKGKLGVEHCASPDIKGRPNVPRRKRLLHVQSGRPAGGGLAILLCPRRRCYRAHFTSSPNLAPDGRRSCCDQKSGRRCSDGPSES